MSVRVGIVIGTRPEAIKLAPLLLELRRREGCDARLIVTAQHREMLDQVLDVFGVVPDIDLDLMRPDQSLAEITARCIQGLDRAFTELEPDLVINQGDTTTALTAALAAFYRRIPVGHVEAGLRTYDFQAPWPEEMNRRLCDPISRWCFAPTRRAADCLQAEQIPLDRIHVTGNTVIDALLIARDRTRKTPPRIEGLAPGRLDASSRLILVTGHRRESFGEPFREFCLALRDLARTHQDTTLVYPVHLNPNVQAPVHEILAREERIHLIPPLSYLPFVHLMDKAHLIVTDSGGVQEEAPALGVPVVVTRDVTERPEAVDAGVAILVGTERQRIVDTVNDLLTNDGAYAKAASGGSPFGDGKACERIADILLHGESRIGAFRAGSGSATA